MNHTYGEKNVKPTQDSPARKRISSWRLDEEPRERIIPLITLLITGLFVEHNVPRNLRSCVGRNRSSNWN